MTDKQLEKKLEPFAEMLYETFMGVVKQRQKIEKKIMKDFGAVEVYVSVANDGVRMLITMKEGAPIHLRFKY